MLNDVWDRIADGFIYAREQIKDILPQPKERPQYPFADYLKKSPEWQEWEARGRWGLSPQEPPEEEPPGPPIKPPFADYYKSMMPGAMTSIQAAQAPKKGIEIAPGIRVADDGQVWKEGTPFSIGSMDPETGKFTQAAWVTGMEGVEWALAPASLFGQAMFGPFEQERIAAREKELVGSEFLAEMEAIRAKLQAPPPKVNLRTPEGKAEWLRYVDEQNKARARLLELERTRATTVAKAALPGGVAYKEYREKPIWQQLFAEAPVWAAVGQMGATGIRATLAPAAAKPGIAAIPPTVARGILYPLAQFERVIGYLPSKAFQRIAKIRWTRQQAAQWAALDAEAQKIVLVELDTVLKASPQLALRATPETLSKITYGMGQILRAAPAAARGRPTYGVIGEFASEQIGRESARKAARAYAKFVLEWARPVKPEFAIEALKRAGFSSEAIQRMTLETAEKSIIGALGEKAAIIALLKAYIPEDTELVKLIEAMPEVMPPEVVPPEVVPPEAVVPKPEVTPPIAEVPPTIPVAEAGMPEPGVQAAMMEVPEKLFRPEGKGVVTQIKMEDFAKLKALEAVPGEEYTEAEIAAMEFELVGLKEWLPTEPAAKFADVVAKAGAYKGEINTLTRQQYRILTGAKWVTQKAESGELTKVLIGGREPTHGMLTPDGKRVRWEYALDTIATEQGYPSGDALKEAIENVVRARARIRDLESTLKVAVEEGPVDYGVAWSEPVKRSLTSQLKEIYSEIQVEVSAAQAAMKGLKGEEAKVGRQSLTLLEKELKSVDKLLNGVEQAGTDIKGLRQKIWAVGAFKGIPDTQMRKVFEQVTGIRNLAPMTKTQLEEILKAVRRARPISIRGNTVLKLGTERAIQSLKSELISTGKLTQDSYNKIMRYLRLSTDRYVNANLFITEAKGRQLIKTLNYEAEVGLIEYDARVAKSLEGDPERSAEISDRKERIAKETERYIEGKPVGISPLWDMRYYTMKLQSRTQGQGRFYDIWIRANIIHLENFARAQGLMKQIQNSTPAYKEIVADEKALGRISDYIASKNKMIPKAPEDIKPEEIKVANAIEKVLFGFRNDVRYYRFRDAYEKHGNKVDRIIEDIPDAPREDIRQAIRIYDSKGADALRKFLDTKTWGVIESGYEPMRVINPRLSLHKAKDVEVGKGHLQKREGIQFLSPKDNITHRTRQYVNQMLSLKIEPYLKELDRTYFETAHLLKNPGAVRQHLSLAINELKGYVGDRTPAIVYLSKFGSLAYTAIFLQPHLSFRNLFQNLAFHPDKEAFFNPANRILTKQEMQFIKTYVSQRKSFARDILLQEELGFGRFARFARAITYYGYSDDVNRIASFWASINKAERALKQYQRDGNIKNFIATSGLSDLTLEQQIETLEMFGLDKVEYGVSGLESVDGGTAAIRNIAKEITNNTHFLYDRAQRAPLEMGAAARLLTSLLVFTRSWAQRMYNQLRILRPGSKASTGNKRRAWKVLLSIMVGSYVAGEIYRKATGKKRNPYDPFNILSYQVGGLPIGVAADTSDALFTLVEAARGNEYALGELPTKLTRVADSVIILYGPLMNILESLTDTEYIDRYALRKIRAQFDKDYMPKEDYYEKERGWIGKIQHALFGGEEPEPSDVEKALTSITGVMPKLGTVDEEARQKAIEEAETPNDLIRAQEKDYTYTMSDLGSDIREATSKLDLDLISEDNGFPPLVMAYWEAQPLLDEYYDQLSENREAFRRYNPEVDAALVVWKGYKTFASWQAQAIVNDMMLEYDIPKSAIPALAKPQAGAVETTPSVSPSMYEMRKAGEPSRVPTGIIPPTPPVSWENIKNDLGSSLLQALERLWYRRGSLTQDEINKLKRIHSTYPLGQKDFNAWVKQSLRQFFENSMLKREE